MRIQSSFYVIERHSVQNVATINAPQMFLDCEQYFEHACSATSCCERKPAVIGISQRGFSYGHSEKRKITNSSLDVSKIENI